MFDPTDFSYKDIVDNLRIDDVIFEGDPETYQNTCSDVYPVNTTTGLYELSQSEVLLVLNNCEDITRATAKCSLESTTDGGSYEPTLLDDHTVNQFLLPANGVNDENKETTLSPDLLALHTCVLCNDIFTSDAELLDHTISRHVTEPNVAEPLLQPATIVPVDVVEKINEVSVAGLDTVGDVENPVTELENDWLVCGVCERVLSSATLEVGCESVDQVCCTDKSGVSSVVRRGLHTMYVCSTCSGLFAEGEALDRHKSICELMGEAHLTAESPVSSEVIQPTLFNPDVCFTCDDCGEQYSSAEELKVHAVSSHPAFRPPSGRRPYVRNTSSKMWNCGSCNQLFATARELYKHKRGEDRPEGAPLTAHVCEECDKVLGSTCALHTHRKMHKISKPGYPCRICGRRFNQSGHLAIHMRMHTGERPYPCDLCPKAFKVKVERDDHRRTHTGERPFACPLCPKTFTAAARLREHARIHTDQRPYKCEVCGAAFRRPYARTVHTLIHTGEKPHECDICNTAFRRSGDMWKHKRTIHWAQMEEEVSKR